MLRVGKNNDSVSITIDNNLLQLYQTEGFNSAAWFPDDARFDKTFSNLSQRLCLESSIRHVCKLICGPVFAHAVADKIVESLDKGVV